MFNRVLYKKNAREQLHGRWKTPVIISLIIWAFGAIFSLPSLITSFINYPVFFNFVHNNVAFFEFSANMEDSQAPQLLSGLVICILVFAEITVYLKMIKTKEIVKFNAFLEGLSHWFKAIRASLWFGLWVFLWSLLFCIPGIVKAISYSQMFFLLAENPKLSVLKAMRISKVLTNGHKSDLFVMFLSFLGWLFLTCITFGIAAFWIKPYIKLSFANAYQDLKQMAFNTKILTPEELNPEA